MNITRKQMIERLSKVQNHTLNHNVDIMTITGFMDDLEVHKHLLRNEQACYQHDENAA
jgi:hypothetical protein